MKILIVGGHHKASFLTKSLIENGHKVTVINKDKNWCKFLAHTHGVTCVYGDGSKPFVLSDAGAHEMDAVIALSNKDASNLIICKLAKKIFNVKNTFAIVNDPNLAKIFRSLGVDKVISSNEVMSDMIEYEVLIDNVVNYLPMENEKIIVVEYIVDVRSKVADKKIDEIDLPKRTVLAYVIREDKILNAHEVDQLLIADKVVLLVKREDFDKVKSLFYWG